MFCFKEEEEEADLAVAAMMKGCTEVMTTMKAGRARTLVCS